MARLRTTTLRRQVASAAMGLALLGTVIVPAGLAQEIAPGTTGIGRPATEQDIRAVDFDARPDGQGLPPGGGTATQGREIYAARCAGCHGEMGEGLTGYPRLIGTVPYRVGETPISTGNFWPFAPPIWEYIYRAMPWDAPQTLSADEVYALTAWVLAEHGIIGENDRMDDRTLPQVTMPNRDAYLMRDPRPDVP